MRGKEIRPFRRVLQVAAVENLQAIPGQDDPEDLKGMQELDGIAHRGEVGQAIKEGVEETKASPRCQDRKQRRRPPKPNGAALGGGEGGIGAAAGIGQGEHRQQGDQNPGVIPGAAMTRR